MIKIKVENESYIKDSHNGAILETDKSALIQHRRARQRIEESKNKVIQLEQKVEKMESILNNIIKELNDKLSAQNG